jgi:WD40 repeat protein
LATASDDKSVGLWEVTSGQRLFSLNGPSGFVKSAGFSSDGETVIAAGQDYGASRGMILFWRVSDGSLLHAYAQQTSTAVYSAQYSPDGNFFAYGRADGAVVLARISTPSCPCSISSSSQTFSPSGGSGRVNIAMSGNCPWNATSNVPWLTLTSTASGSGSSVIKFNVSENSADRPRAGTLTIGYQTLTIIEEGIAYSTKR